jgi:hypothetical protein
VLPLAWFYVSLVVFLYALLFYLEMKARARRHVKGCPSRPYISPARLDSLIAIEPDLFVIELSSGADRQEQPQIPDARRMSVSQLENFLQKASRRSVFVFYDTVAERATWSLIECIVKQHTMRNVFVLRGGLEMWLSKHQANGLAVAT